MKTFLIRVLPAMALCASCIAQNTPAGQTNGTQMPAQHNATAAEPGSPNAGQVARIAPGSVIPVELMKTIDAKKVKTGDPVEAKVTQDMKAGNGEVIVPKDTKVTGHITEAQARTKEEKESQLGILFDHAAVKNGPEMQMPMSIQAIIAPPSMNSGGETATAPPNPASSPGGMMPAGRSPGMAGANPPANTPPVGGGETPEGNNQANSRPPITGKTEGVIGISNLSLSAASNSAQGSVVTSEKGNVKLEGGTLMLLRVGQ
jgi:hypothetical protein